MACFSNTMGMEVYLVGCEHLKHTFSINISASSAQMKSLRGYESGLSNDTDSLPCLSFAQKFTLYHTRLFALFNFSLKSSQNHNRFHYVSFLFGSKFTNLKYILLLLVY
jgi:hypothetical protein